MFWTGLGGGVGVVTVGILAIGKLMGIQKAMDAKLSVEQHNVICKERDAEIKDSLNKITNALDTLVKKDALDDIKSTLSKHIEARSIIDDRQETFRHDLRNSVQVLTTQVAILQTTVNMNKDSLAGLKRG